MSSQNVNKIIVFSIILLFGLFLILSKVQAAAVVWNGAGADGTCGGAGTANNWSCGANWVGGVAPSSSDTATFDNTSDKNAVIDSEINVAGIDINSGYDGQINQNAKVTVGTSNFDQASGTWNGNAQIFDDNGSLIVSGGTHNATTGTFTLARDLTYSGGNLVMTGVVVTLDGGYTNSTTVSCTGELGGDVRIAKSEYRANVTIGAGCIVNTTSINGVVGTILINGTLNHTGTVFNVDGDAGSGNLEIADGGTLTYSGTNITLEGNLTKTGTFNMTGITVTLDGSAYWDDSIITCAGVLGGTVQLAKNEYRADVTIGSGCIVNTTSINGTFGTITINGTLNHAGTVFNVDGYGNGASFIVATGGEVTYSGSAITLSESFTLIGTFDLSGKTITFDGIWAANDSTITCGSGKTINGNIVINKTNVGGVTIAGSDCTFLGSFTRTDGVISNPSSPYTWSIQGNLSMSTTDAFGGSNLTIKLSGGDLQTISQNAALAFNSPLEINKSGNKVVLGTALNLENDLTITVGELDNSGTSYQINIAGDWSNSGSFTANSGAVVFDGSNQSILGSTQFYDLNKTTGSTDTLTFANNGTQIITHTLTLQGAVDNVLTLQSDSHTNQWEIDPRGTRTLSYLAVHDSNNINGVSITTADLNIQDLGDNYGWIFGEEETPVQTTRIIRLLGHTRLRGGVRLK